MTNYNTYPTVSTEPLAPLDRQSYCLNIIQGKLQELLKLEEWCRKKYKMYTKVLDRHIWLIAFSCSLATRMATLSMFISLPVSIQLGAISLTGVSDSGIATLLNEKYQKKPTKVTKLVDIVTSHWLYLRQAYLRH